MKPDRTVARDVDEYIAGFPPEVQNVLVQIRSTIRETAPEAKEAIKYQIPTYTLKGNLVSFAAYKNHIGLYPVPAGTKKFQKDLAIYRAAKSTARFPLDQPMPFDLILQLVKFRVKENSIRATAKETTRLTRDLSIPQLRATLKGQLITPDDAKYRSRGWSGIVNRGG